MEKAPSKIAPLSGHVFYDDGVYEYRLPRSEQEEREIEDCLIDSFIDNPRYQLFGLTKDILALEYRHARLWDRKNLNLTACYDKKSGKIASVLRFANGDRSELEPMPEAYAKHPAVIRVKAMNVKLE